MQFSLFGAAVAEPSVADLAGILLAGGDWVRADGRARLSIVVADEWRAVAVAAALQELDLGAEITPAENGTAARTAFLARLVPEAARWTLGAVLRPPKGMVLSPGGLRLWAIATGRSEGAPEPGQPATSYVLGTADPFDPIHRLAGAQLARLGLAAAAITVRTNPGWRITSQKRLRRLAELLGEAPPGAGPDWPG